MHYSSITAALQTDTSIFRTICCTLVGFTNTHAEIHTDQMPVPNLYFTISLYNSAVNDVYIYIYLPTRSPACLYLKLLSGIHKRLELQVWHSCRPLLHVGWGFSDPRCTWLQTWGDSRESRPLYS
mgnify:CR=1 FL=1